LKQRIGLRCSLELFDLSDAAAYIAGRIRIAGGSPIEVFTREAVEAVFQGSSGVPRSINVICDNALIGGFAAQVKPVTRAIVEDVVRDFDLLSGSMAPREGIGRREPLKVEKFEERAPDELPLTSPFTSVGEEPEQDQQLFGTFGRKRGFFS